MTVKHVYRRVTCNSFILETIRLSSTQNYINNCNIFSAILLKNEKEWITAISNNRDESQRHANKRSISRSRLFESMYMKCRISKAYILWQKVDEKAHKTIWRCVIFCILIWVMMAVLFRKGDYFLKVPVTPFVFVHVKLCIYDTHHWK
jgi:hypothetical protein